MPIAPVERVRPIGRLTPETLPKFLEAVRVKYKLPGLGAAVVRGERVSVATVGVRKIGDKTPITNEDGWHLGSCTKSMTSVLLAMLVEEGKLSWDSTLPTTLPDLADSMLPAYRTVTLRQLLCHQAGLPKTVVPKDTSYNQWQIKTESLPQQRIEYTRTYLSQEPVYPPGTRMIYSNAGYVIAGAIAERITGQSWEDAMRQRLFKPLEMNSVTFGTQISEKPLEPWPHTIRDGEPVAISADSAMEMPMVIGPAGLVRCSLDDWAKYAKFWLRGLRGQSELLRPETLRFLSTSPNTLVAEDADKDSLYGCGWYLVNRGWSRDTILMHSGSNRKNFSVIWMAPEHNFAVLIVTNRDDASQACDDVASALVTELTRLR